jgi:diguanylate cyclase (GGDEF)-like protein
VAAEESPAGRPFRSLTSTLIRSIVLAGALCAVVVALIQLALTYHAQRRNFESEVQSIAQINVPLLSVNLWDIEPDAIRRQMKGILDRPQIAHVRLEAATGQEFESGNEKQRGAPGSIVLSIPYPGGKPGALGTLQVSPNVDHLYRQLAIDMLGVLASSALFTALIAIVVTVILRRQLEMPMQRIAEFAGSLKPAELMRPLNLMRPHRRWRDEIDEVADGFRVLQDDIRHHVEDLDRQVAQRTAELKRANLRLEGLSRRDPLTGLANRRHFDQERARAWDEMVASRRPISLMMLDIDYFKHYNDTYGHAAGDECLVAVARELADTFQKLGELAVRMGGEEFAVLFDDVALDDAMARAESYRRRVYALAVPHTKSAYGRVTVSIGVSSVDPSELPGYVARGTATSGTAELLGRADQALYEAKAAGRNRVVGIAFASSEAIQKPVEAGVAASTTRQ